MQGTKCCKTHNRPAYNIGNKGVIISYALLYFFFIIITNFINMPMFTNEEVEMVGP